jgi:hypothetical protein
LAPFVAAAQAERWKVVVEVPVVVVDRVMVRLVKSVLVKRAIVVAVALRRCRTAMALASVAGSETSLTLKFEKKKKKKKKVIISNMMN